MASDIISLSQEWRGFNLIPLADRNRFFDRIRVCDTCPHKRQLLASGGWSTSPENLQGAQVYCGLCGCSLVKKAGDPDNECPDRPPRWEKELTFDSFY